MANPVVTFAHPDGRKVTLHPLPQAIAELEAAGYTLEAELTPETSPTKPSNTRNRTGDGGTDEKETE